MAGNLPKILFAALMYAALGGISSAKCAEPIDRLSVLHMLDVGEAAKGAAVLVSGTVTYVRSDGFVIVARAEREQNAVFVVRTPETVGPVEIHEGDKFRVEGRTCVWENIAAVKASSLMRTGEEPLPTPKEPKWYDVRMGLRNLRRGRIEGWIYAVDYVQRPGDGVPETVLTLRTLAKTVSVHVAGHMTPNIAHVGNEIEAVGITRNIFDDEGNVLASFFEVSSEDGITLLATSREWLLIAFLLATGIIAVIAAVGFCTAWLRAKRKRRDAELLDREHKRIAANLHDTIEQHLAGARILLDGAANIKDVPDAALKRIRMACSMLANAKQEVRESVTGLATNIRDTVMLADAIENVAKDVTRLGQATATADCTELRAEREVTPGDSPACLLLIVREAVSNAIKHGKAKNIRITVTRTMTSVANDGEPFDGNATLGPEMGHYGLSNMRERCSHQGWSISFSSDGTWSEVRIDHPNAAADAARNKGEAKK